MQALQIAPIACEVAYRNIAATFDFTLPFEVALVDSLLESDEDWKVLRAEALVGWAVQLLEGLAAPAPEPADEPVAFEATDALCRKVDAIFQQPHYEEEAPAPEAPATKSATFHVTQEVYDEISWNGRPHVWQPEVEYLYVCGWPAPLVDALEARIAQVTNPAYMTSAKLKAAKAQAVAEHEAATVVQEPVVATPVDTAPDWHPARYRTMQQFLKWARDVRKVALRCKCNAKAEVLRKECERVARLIAKQG